MYNPNKSLIFPLADHKIQLRTTQAFLFELKSHALENASLIAPYLHLHNAVLACWAALSSTECPRFSKKDKISSGKMIEHQWRFTTTIEGPGKKRKENTLQWVSIWYNSKHFIWASSFSKQNNRHPDAEKSCKLLEELEDYSADKVAKCNT